MDSVAPRGASAAELLAHLQPVLRCRLRTPRPTRKLLVPHRATRPPCVLTVVTRSHPTNGVREPVGALALEVRGKEEPVGDLDLCFSFS